MQQCIDRYGGLVWSMARRWANDAADAEDAVQEVFISLWQHAERFDPKVASESTFVTMIARRRLIDRRRRLSRRREVELPEGDHVEPTEEVDLSLAPDAEVAEKALTELRPEQQKVLRLSIYHGLTHSEIATHTGIPLGTVKTHARRGLIRIREALQTDSRPTEKGVRS